jgi:hypothetical protein
LALNYIISHEEIRQSKIAGGASPQTAFAIFSFHHGGWKKRRGLASGVLMECGKTPLQPENPASKTKR